MNIVFDALQVYLPAKRKQTPSGWLAFNAPCCEHNGTTPDTRQRGGLIANAAQRADNGVIVNKVATKLDQQIKQFKASNAMSMFQRQIVLVFSPLENYVFGSGKIDFPKWFPKNVLISGLLQWTEKLVIDIASHSRTQ